MGPDSCRGRLQIVAVNKWMPILLDGSTLTGFRNFPQVHSSNSCNDTSPLPLPPSAEAGVLRPFPTGSKEKSWCSIESEFRVNTRRERREKESMEIQGHLTIGSEPYAGVYPSPTPSRSQKVTLVEFCSAENRSTRYETPPK